MRDLLGLWLMGLAVHLGSCYSVIAKARAVLHGYVDDGCKAVYSSSSPRFDFSHTYFQFIFELDSKVVLQFLHQGLIFATLVFPSFGSVVGYWPAIGLRIGWQILL